MYIIPNPFMFNEHPEAARRLRSFFGIPQATIETLSRYIITFGSGASWWACVGAPHLNLLRTAQNPSEHSAVKNLLELLDNRVPIDDTHPLAG